MVTKKLGLLKYWQIFLTLRLSENAEAAQVASLLALHPSQFSAASL